MSLVIHVAQQMSCSGDAGRELSIPELMLTNIANEFREIERVLQVLVLLTKCALQSNIEKIRN